MVNYYEVLGISNTATLDEIKKAYNNLVKIYYPDKNTGNKEMFELIVQAYKHLSNSKKREEYDISLKTTSDFNALKRNFKKDVKTIKVNTDELQSGFKDKALPKEEFDNMILDRDLIRNQDDIENMPSNIFNGDFDNEIFNTVFENNQVQENKIVKVKNAYSFIEDSDSFSYIQDNKKRSDNSSLDDFFGNFGENQNIDINNITKRDTKDFNKIDPNVFEDSYQKLLNERMNMNK